MSGQALAGLALLNALYLACGLAIVWVLRGTPTWLEVVRLGGLGYLVGVASAGCVWALLLVAGIPFSLALALLVPIVIAGVALGVGVRQGRRGPRAGSARSGPALLVTAVGIAVAGLVLEAAFRAARLNGLQSWDGWSFWVPKAKAIYYFDALDHQFFTQLPGSSYPPLVPVLDAAAFHAMGSPDVVTLHVQYWLFGVGFVWALAGLLSPRVPAWILWPFVLLALVAPRVGRRLDVPEADLLLDYFFAAAAVLLFRWLLERQTWQLASATVLLSGLVMTKREGLLLGALLVVATLLAGLRDVRAVWRPLLAMVAFAAAVAIPWRVWYVAHGVGGEASETSLDPGGGPQRLWDSLRLAFEVLLDTGYWSIAAPVAIAALVLAALARAMVPAVFFGALILLVTLGGGWITWAIPELEITEEGGTNPIGRFMGAAALTCIAAAPVLLASAWSAAGRAPRAGAASR